MALPPVLDEENLYKFRTKICERYVKQGKCEFADKCQYSHDLRWTRRPPWKYTYSPELCRDLVFVTDGRGRTIAKSNCKQKRNCRFAHTKEEQMYHPKVYKTAMCHQFKENGWCDRYYCPFAHSDAELRPTEQSEEGRRTFAKAAVQEVLCPDIYLPSDRPHPRLRARFLAIMDGIPSQSHLHLALDPNYLCATGGARTRQPYTDFISSHTPHSVLSDGSPSAHGNKTCNSQGGSHAAGSRRGQTEEPWGREEGTADNNTARADAAKQAVRRYGRSATLNDRSIRRARCAEQCFARLRNSNPTGGAATTKLDGSSSRQADAFPPSADADGLKCAGMPSAFSGVHESVLPFPSAYASTHSAASAQQWTSTPGSPTASRTPALHTVDAPEGLQPNFYAQISVEHPADVLLPPVQGDRHTAAVVEGGMVPPATMRGRPPPLPARGSAKKNLPQPLAAAPATFSGKTEDAWWVAHFRVKCLTSDVCYWNEPIGRSRDDLSVLVYAGLVLGPGKSREIVAVKQLPVVVSSRAADLWKEVQAFLSIRDPLLVNVRRALLLPGEADEGTSLWVITEKCQGSIIELFPSGAVPASFLQSAFPSSGLNGLLYHLLKAVHSLHSYSKSAHMRIHPGNVMVGSQGEIKLGDCAGNVRYLSILDLLHAGVQGASNAKALLQWILGTPQETCWMAPEFVSSLINLDEELKQMLWHCSSNGLDNSRCEAAFIQVARTFKWRADFLQRADAWSIGATLFFIASGGHHPYGSTNNPLILANILADKKVNFDKLGNCPWQADLLAGLVSHNPAQRLTITQALHHPLFWTSEDIEKYLQDLRAALETGSEEAAGLQEALSYNIGWVDSLSLIPSPFALLPLLFSYVATPSASPLLLSAHPPQSASSFLGFLACISGDSRIAVVERRLAVSQCLLAHAAPFLHSVYLFLFPKLADGTSGPQPQGAPSPPVRKGQLFWGSTENLPRPLAIPSASKAASSKAPAALLPRESSLKPASAAAGSLPPPALPPPAVDSALGQRLGSFAANAKAVQMPAAAAALAAAAASLRVQALIREGVCLSGVQPKAGGLRAPRDGAGAADREGRPAEGSPRAATRSKKGTKAEAKQRTGGGLKEGRCSYPCAADRVGPSTKAQSEGRLLLPRGKAAAAEPVWACPTPGVGKATEGASDPLSAKPMQGEAPPPQTEASSSSSGTGSSEAAAATPAPQEKLQQDQHAAPRPARPLHAPLTPARGYREDAQASRRGVFAAGLAEVKFNLKPNAALLQMPVAVSTVSTAHSSATVSDFCHGPSQPIEGAVEEGSWRTEAAPGSAADTCLQKLEKQREGKDGKQHEATGLKLVDPTPTDVPKEAVSGQAPLGQSAGGAENLRRDTSNACCIQ
ncbi:uncharacterized protein LOC34623902 [Cyclospora cayetanensis]|uniref:Uncharacterized protein LOC34623902 n=1 Tax=Cyclospora cayetanensis TaxID=88456 RepID=A0A6P6RZI3_9EIME|nr:uncharacterized protein LOC34623902 [Cyclospora cayetanensis]